MKTIFITLAFLLAFSACKKIKDDAVRQDLSMSSTNPTISKMPEDTSQSLDSSEEDTPQYQGISIDQQFSLIENHDFQEEDFNDKTYAVKAENFQVTFTDFKPDSIRNETGQTLFKFKTLYKEGYWANLIGVSNLLGENSKEIYVAASGTGGVCCTNYWITDISDGKPRNVFRSEDYGYFRDAMEVFDADGDGIFEIVQFDSAFRYFMNDCGSCSPEPRAVFKYNEKAGKYVPAKNIQQDFVKESLSKTETRLAETNEKLKIKNDPGEAMNFERTLLAHIVDLIYSGNETKAWKMFNDYYADYSEKEKIRAEIKKRLRQSKFYQALKKSS